MSSGRQEDLLVQLGVDAGSAHRVDSGYPLSPSDALGRIQDFLPPNSEPAVKSVISSAASCYPQLDSDTDRQGDQPLQPKEKAARISVRFAMRNSHELSSRYTVSGICGLGSNGVVLRGTLTSSLRNVVDVAIKIIYKRRNREDEASDPSRNEIDAISRIPPHENIIRYLDSWEDNRHHYLVTELISSDSMFTHQCTSSKDLIFDSNGDTVRLPFNDHSSTDVFSWSVAHSPLPHTSFTLPHVQWPLHLHPLPQVRMMFAQVAMAVQHLHALGWAHGDIKEENVLYSDESGCVLADLGHAVMKGAASRGVARYGTRAVTPPELLINIKKDASDAESVVRVDPMPADVFALGLFLFSLMHGPGVLPEAAEDAVRNGCLERVEVDGGFPLGPVRDDAPRALLELLRGMTMVEPGQRWTIDDVIACEWFKD